MIILVNICWNKHTHSSSRPKGRPKEDKNERLALLLKGLLPLFLSTYILLVLDKILQDDITELEKRRDGTQHASIATIDSSAPYLQQIPSPYVSAILKVYALSSLGDLRSSL